MNFKTCNYLSGLACAATLALGLAVVAPTANGQSNSYKTSLLVSDTKLAPHQDPNLVNPWGLCTFPNDSWWVSDNSTGLSTLYDGEGNIQSLVVTIPPSVSQPAGTLGTPTGCIANSTTDFTGAPFLFATEDGTISSWAGGASAVIRLETGGAASYKGISIGQMGSANVLYAADFLLGTMDVFDSDFHTVTLGPQAFVDPKLPAGFAPFNVQVIGESVYVAFARQQTGSIDEQDGPGLGFVDKFDASGNLQMRFEHGPFMNAPWGIAIAPSDFGAFSNDLLVGQFGSGVIVAFDPTTGKAEGLLKRSDGQPIVLPGLWAIDFGLGGTAGPETSLYFTAGTKNESHGFFGTVTAQ